MKNHINKRLAALGGEGLKNGTFCGISATVSVRKSTGWIRGQYSGGVTRIDTQGRAVDISTLFDLASLTKPLCTTLVFLHLLDRGGVDWDSPLGAEYPPDKQGIQVRHILQHTAGFPSYKPYYLRFTAQQLPLQRKLLLESILHESLISPAGSTSLYSDLGFLLLGDLIERKTQCPLDRLFHQRITGPLGLSEELLFLPVGDTGPVTREKIAATENCSWRQTLVQGEVHDEHCWLMGGVAGHAGLFGTAQGVSRLCECLLDVWKGRCIHPAFDPVILRHALEAKNPQGVWSYGFDRPTPGASSSGQFFSAASVGHLGFTGTSFWIDPVQNVVVVLLTNRVHPTRENIQIRSFRPWFHDQIMEIV